MVQDQRPQEVNRLLHCVLHKTPFVSTAVHLRLQMAIAATRSRHTSLLSSPNMHWNRLVNSKILVLEFNPCCRVGKQVSCDALVWKGQETVTAALQCSRAQQRRVSSPSQSAAAERLMGLRPPWAKSCSSSAQAPAPINKTSHFIAVTMTF